MKTPEVIANPNRRQVLCGLAAALVAGGAVTTACGSASPSGSGGTNTTTDSPKPQAAPGTEVAKLAQVPVGGGVVVDEPGGTGNKLVLVQPTAGEVKAFNAACPHQGITVAAPQGGVITCPGHGSTFTAATGAVTKGPATEGLTAVNVKVSGAAVVLA
ncbi:Rieske (2Fe-2S) protein [Kutzneria kofuensis]|uniref:Nitrite reductase/ring-hydroxylating ferredoxin subunit n=1 Tax=Kutzneria kofuensis TaxID=103725 RepID=A0A7W9KBT0_9PSEU|nr:Rieske (2Fe-2S) protein [Kutzneria kofuensis]MBB5889555.1 nitrite reductase/ring-hydroxylating ferredoxin subunit [Kutzneria kofuensis]